ncbi:MAG: hypothetical protein RH917_15030 [Lacipirellulaceae bacterium]
MKSHRIAETIAVGLVFVAMACPQIAQAELSFDPTWDIPTADKVKQEVTRWAAMADLEKQQLDQLLSNWSQSENTPSILLEKVVESFALTEPRVAELLKLCREPYTEPPLPDTAWLNDEPLDEQGLSKFLRANVSLYYARWLAQHRLYDETIVLLESIKPAEVIDPAALFFYRAVAYQQVVKPDLARAEIVRLLEREEEIPRRFQQVARLLERDLANLDDESLGKVAKQMDDVGRRLSLGRAGRQVQVIEDDVLDALDKLIKQAEEQQKQQQSSASPPSQSDKPMEDSRPTELKAPGRVDAKDIGKKAGWGDLPPKEREQALQQIGRDFPAHYREVIEEYFRELATESSESNPTSR